MTKKTTVTPVTSTFFASLSPYIKPLLQKYPKKTLRRQLLIHKKRKKQKEKKMQKEKNMQKEQQNKKKFTIAPAISTSYLLISKYPDIFGSILRIIRLKHKF